jgi:hypothetical protein
MPHPALLTIAPNIVSLEGDSEADAIAQFLSGYYATHSR